MMNKIIVIFLGITLSAYAAEISTSYALLEKQGQFQPDLKTEPVDKPNRNVLEERHPVYNPEERRAKIHPVKPSGDVVKHDRMLSDQPTVDMKPHDNQMASGYEYIPGFDEVAYPDVPYAPGYGYNNGHSASNRYDNIYGNSPSPYYVEPDTSPFSLLWSQVPDARTMVTYVSSLISWTFGSILLLFLGSALTVGVCSYTDFCTIAYNGIGPIHEEMRAYITPDNLDKLSSAAKFVKNAINKLDEEQKVASVAVRRRRRAILH